ncbi:hypothetical protein DYB32_005630 [Aphanomyces invadans]|uniref:GTPase Der n=1 Tax=Aphanomyces invadans TaxID=157072 RepID=A0A418AU11_9STRA|nr:hypothetical protein DYB32_005630 [Aphanomyces invadans]
MLRFLRSRALPTLAPVKSHVLFSTKSAPQLPERARIALVGRTNVGKSTLFNRLTKSRGAIVHNVPGTTRDRRFAGYLAGLEFDVIDTGGLADAPSGRWLRKADPQSPIQLVANKLEGDATQWLGNIHDSYQLGMGEPLVISAEHGEGLTDLVPLLEPLVQGHAAAVAAEKAALASELSSDDEGFNDSFDSSTLLNKIVRDNRVLTGPEYVWRHVSSVCHGCCRPGVTRDAVEVKWEFQGREITLVDTAGIRRFSKRDHSNQIENLSVRDTYDAISSAQVVCVVVDVSEEHLIHLDLTIAQRVLDEGRALVLVANKADLVGDAEAEIERIRKELDGSLAQVKYITQVKARPPTFALFVNKAEDVPESYRRFLLNQLRTEFDMIGVPARLLLRGSEDNPYKRGYSRAKPTSRRPAVAKPVPFGGRNTSPKAASPTRPVAIATIPAAKTPSKKANVVRGTHKHKIRSLSPGAKPSNSKGRAARREPAKKPSGRGGRDAPTSRPSKKSGGGGMQKGKSSRRHKTDRTTLRDPSAKKASRWSAKKKESIKRHNGTRKPRTG